MELGSICGVVAVLFSEYVRMGTFSKALIRIPSTLKESTTKEASAPTPPLTKSMVPLPAMRVLAGRLHPDVSRCSVSEYCCVPNSKRAVVEPTSAQVARCGDIHGGLPGPSDEATSATNVRRKAMRGSDEPNYLVVWGVQVSRLLWVICLSQDDEVLAACALRTDGYRIGTRDMRRWHGEHDGGRM